MTKRILVVDDEPQNISIIAEILERKDYEIFAALNGDSAVKIAEEKLPDLIIMDWDMPIMNGIEATKLLKKKTSTQNIPVIIISGVMVKSENLNMALEAGAIDFVRKPVDEIELIARARSMLMLSSYYKQTVDLKNRELLTVTMKLSKNNEYLTYLQERLTEISHGEDETVDPMKVKINQLIRDINFKVKSDSWSQFENYFNKVHPKFTQNLLNIHPGLTPNDIKLCSFLVLNLDTKEIASIVNQKSNSIRIARTRLRKKLNLKQEESLVSYLLSVAV